MKTPILETQRLLLRPMTPADAESAYRNWTSDPEVARFMTWDLHTDVEVTREWLEADEAAIDSDTQYNWGFVLKDTGELIGSGGLIYKENRGMFELGYNLTRRYWRQGLTTEAAREIIRFGIEQLHQTRFFCCHAKDNPASGAVMEKVGFRYRQDGTYSSFSGTRTFQSREYSLTVNEPDHI